MRTPIVEGLDPRDFAGERRDERIRAHVGCDADCNVDCSYDTSRGATPCVRIAHEIWCSFHPSAPMNGTAG